MRVAFVTLASRDYFPGARRLFESIKKHTKSRDFESILFSDEPNASKYFEHLFDRILIIPTGGEVFSFNPVVPRFEFTLHKLSTLKFLELENYDRVIFFDSDLLCTSSISPLLGIHLNEHDFLAVRDYASSKYYPNRIAELNLDPERIFNTGCFVLNRSILKFLNYSDLVSQISETNLSYDGGDQGYFNYIIQNSDAKLQLLPLRFNYPLDINYPKVWTTPTLIHFSGAKPWVNSIQTPSWDSDMYRLWNLGESTWKDFPSRRVRTRLYWYKRNFHILYSKFDFTLRGKAISLRNSTRGWK